MSAQAQQPEPGSRPAGRRPAAGRQKTKVAMPPGGGWVLAATILASSMAFIDGTALNVALPVMQADLDATGAQLLWVINGYLLMLAAFILVSGTLGDRFGRKLVFTLGIAVFTLGSIACGLTPGIRFLIGARVLEGIGGAMMIPGSLAIIATYFEGAARGRAIGTWAAVTTIVTVVGPLLGGFLADVDFWRGVFFINTPLAIAALIILYLHVPESSDPGSAGRIDFAGAALAAAGLAGITYGFISAPGGGFSSPPVYLSLAAGAAALIAFVAVEYFKRQPMLPLRLFRSRTFSGANLLTLFLYGAISVGAFFLSLNLIQVQHYSPALAGISFLPFGLILAGMSRWAGGLVYRLGPRPPLIAGPALVGIGFIGLAIVGLTAGPSAYWYTYLPGLIVFSSGMGVTVAPLSTAVMGALSPRHAGTASGVNNAVARTAGVLAIAVLGSFMLFSFSSELSSRAQSLQLPPDTANDLNSQAGRLGETQVPDQVAPQDRGTVQDAIQWSFVDSFRRLMLICAGLAWLSGMLAFVLVRRQLEAMD